MKQARTLPRTFYLRSPDIVARDLLGKLLVRRLDGELLTGRIVEVEAYFGLGDPAAHSASGKTARNEVIFGPPGFAYVYFIYGMHYCLNISCEPEGQAGCVLLRALEPVGGLETMARLRGLAPHAKPRLLTSGPGRLCQALGITRAIHNALDVTDAESGLQVEEDGFFAGSIMATPRIGIRKAAERPLRFLLEGNRFVSGG
ncbi:DNA-3-methyladenine glycosylase [Paracidobacterium acidisoli]|uniref:Putative 3-methyladenine DNA glycosylase n=1 Tax=Paracidobacterium acidisoli TaxID=2303751 RepID=A0A372IMI5_9BACT|nr:DNA-3-methyladenine glycosylase [Paracidobacterium acidisoli]MBT9331717.1 DNA-3-methyladenine glycosylase [Paracidobacterium acidisoli]